MEKKKIQIPLSFSAIDQYVEQNVITPVEKEISGQKFIQWGERNLYPQFIYDAYEGSATLKAIIQSVVDYVVGDGVESGELILNDEKLERLVYMMAFSYAVYGAFAVNVLRNRIGGIADLIVMDVRNLRSDENNEIFYYSPDYTKKSYGRCKYVEYPKFDPTNKEQYSSIFYVKNTVWQTYGQPCWSAAVRSALIEAKIGDYHYNNLENGFAGSVMVNLCNGVPTEEVQEQIEEDFNEKFCGSENAGRVVISYSQDQDHKAEILQIKSEDFADKYNALSKYANDELFKAFRCNPNLVGIATESNGFNSEEYESAFKLFNRTVIRPIQKIICNSFDKIFEKQETITITPFSLEGKKEEEVG